MLRRPVCGVAATARLFAARRPMATSAKVTAVVVSATAGKGGTTSLTRSGMPTTTTTTTTTPAEVRVAATIHDVAPAVLADASFVALLDSPAALPTVLASCPKLQVLQAGSAGVEKFATPELAARGVTLCNAKGIYSHALAEYAVAACLHFCKSVPRLRASQRAKTWDRFVIRQLRGATLGVVGYGDIGQAAARLAKPFGMRVVALARTDSPSRDDGGVADAFETDLHALLPQVDYLVLALPITPATRRLLGAAELALLKPTATLVNVGRGQTIDEAALAEALASGRLAAAALDVFETEPLPADSPLWELDNVLISAHTADETEAIDEEVVALALQNIHRFATGGVPALVNVVDMSKGY